MALPSLQDDTRAGLLDAAPDGVRAFTYLENDRRRLDWNGSVDRPFTPFRNQDLERPVIEHFERMVRSQPGRVAIRAADTTLTFGALWDSVSGLAETLAAETEPGDLIGILLPPGEIFAVALLACLASGRPFAAFDVHWPRDWRDHALHEARPKLIITREQVLPRPACKGWRPTPAGVDEPACILFTSGSTGRPKTIVNSQRNLLQRVAQSINAAHINTEDRLLTLAAPCTIVGVRDIMTALLAGASIHLLDPQGVGAREIFNTLRTEAITILFAFPALLRSILAAREERAAAALRLVRMGGDTTLWSDVEMLRNWLTPEAAIQVIYAATEAPMMQWFVDDACKRDDIRVPIGYPLPGNRLALVDEDDHAAAPGDVGELVVASPYVALGRSCFRTGDLARQRSDGLLERVGRKDRQVKIRGTRVDLDGVEAMLRGHPFVRDAAVVARGTTTLVAYVDAPAGTIETLKSLMRSAPLPMRPALYYRAASIPRLPNSKLDIRGLAALDEAKADAHVQVPATVPGKADQISRTVARIWRQVLLVPVRAADDDFFDNGGDSLKAITFAITLERAVGIEIPLTLINEAPTFDRLCEALRERRVPGASPLVTLKTGEGAPPVFFIHGIGGNVISILPTARRVIWPGAVVGIRARGVVRGEVPHTTVEAMAADYLREMKRRQPSGPYYLCGYSSGGLVVFEIARRLSEAGEEVALAGLFDTRMSVVRWPLRAWISVLSRRIARFTAAVRATPIRSWPAKIRAWRTTPGAARTIAIRVMASALIASARYRPGSYSGQLTLFAPAEREPELPSLESVWSKHARRIVVVETPGNHATTLSPLHAEATAACLTRCLTPHQIT